MVMEEEGVMVGAEVEMVEEGVLMATAVSPTPIHLLHLRPMINHPNNLVPTAMQLQATVEVRMLGL